MLLTETLEDDALDVLPKKDIIKIHYMPHLH